MRSQQRQQNLERRRAQREAAAMNDGWVRLRVRTVATTSSRSCLWGRAAAPATTPAPHPRAGRGGRSAERPSSSTSAALATLQATKDADSFLVEIDAAGMPRQSYRYTAPYSFESTDPAMPMLVVDGVSYQQLPPMPGAPADPDAPYAVTPLSQDAGGPTPSSLPVFLDMLESGSGFGGPGYRIVGVETDGTHATVVRAENASGSIVMRFSDFDIATTPPTAPTNTLDMDGP